MTYLKAFIAGFASTLVFHQGLLWLLYTGGFSPRAPWSIAPVPPFNAPAVISLAFWGGVWGIVLWALIRASRGGAYCARDRCAGSESCRVVRSDADEGHERRGRLGPESHRQRTTVKWHLGTRRRSADPATEPSQSSRKKMTTKERKHG
jgi:hypothetical protein